MFQDCWQCVAMCLAQISLDGWMETAYQRRVELTCEESGALRDSSIPLEDCGVR